MKRWILFAIALLAATGAQAAPLKRLPRDVRLCTAGDMPGVHKLRNVLETNPGAATESFNSAPHQYLYMMSNQIYAEAAGSINYPNMRSLQRVMERAFKSDARQFVLGENGALYLYKGGKVTDSYTCEVVKAPEGPFRKGDMLFIQSYPNTSAASVRVYFTPDLSNSKQGKAPAKPQRRRPVRRR